MTAMAPMALALISQAAMALALISQAAMALALISQQQDGVKTGPWWEENASHQEPAAMTAATVSVA